jgi:2-amino-4-hydroxy-6-hydroxymethyldihydropteridine diphosphokinase
MTALQPAYIGVGSNLGDPAAQVRRAFVALAGLAGTRLVAHSRLYGSRPMGPADQPDFVNAAAGLLTSLSPLELLQALQGIEAAQGRRRERRWGERTLDLDLLLYGAVRLESPELTLPHPGLAQRAFVLHPLSDIAPDLAVPGAGRVADLATRLGADGLWLLDGGKA